MPIRLGSKDAPPPLGVSVLRRSALSETVVLVRLSVCSDGPGDKSRAFNWRAGQYVEVAPPHAADASSFYSIASAPDPRAPGEFELAISLSASPQLLRELEPGRKLWMTPAQGDFVWEGGDGAALLIGMGTGVAPLRAMLQAALQTGKPGQGEGARVALVLGARTEATLLFRREFEELARRDARFHFEPVLSRASSDWRGSHGRVQQHLQRVLGDLHPARVTAYVCGTTTMVRETVSLLVGELELPASSVRAESHG
jgi:NAD(P)H-flavin reductase